ncbi:hypothetical protein SAMN05421788_111201 [Filimonas lacunae]|uniref:Uncharacterized protein n=1 Tax=Filimonas lacunae TaxID=477680 RepID=A0A1N7RCH0_9BACT|nr:hypothetical protein [Filimonas lacunae]SIT32694.1 hypothetical protein SAMN05421788_111201 [Filimonas lacunae]
MFQKVERGEKVQAFDTYSQPDSINSHLFISGFFLLTKKRLKGPNLLFLYPKKVLMDRFLAINDEKYIFDNTINSKP